MGIGGHLMWTPLIREIARGNPNNRVVPFETFGTVPRIVKSEIFRGNPTVLESFVDGSIGMCLNDPRTNYCKFDSYEKCIQRCDKHVIHQICEAWGFSGVDLKCELFLDEAELAFGASFKGSLGEYVVIEPHTKNEYTVNKTYPFEKWQRVVDEISKRMTVMQVGSKTDKVLKNCVNLTGATTFRQAAAIIKNARLFVGSEGGLMHASNAVDTPAVILVTGFLHPRMTCYPSNDNIWIGHAHGPCGMKITCEKCQRESTEHDESEITRAVLRRLS